MWGVEGGHVPAELTLRVPDGSAGGVKSADAISGLRLLKCQCDGGEVSIDESNPAFSSADQRSRIKAAAESICHYTSR